MNPPPKKNKPNNNKEAAAAAVPPPPSTNYIKEKTENTQKNSKWRNGLSAGLRRREVSSNINHTIMFIFEKILLPHPPHQLWIK